MISKATSGVIEMIYHASMEQETWGEIATAIGSLVPGALTIFTHDRVSSDVRLLSLHEMELAAVDDYRNRFATHNPVVTRALQRSEGTSRQIEDLMRRDEFDRHEYYNDWFRPQGLHYSTGIFLGVDDRTSMFMALFRPKNEGAYSAAAQREIEALAPHLKRSVAIGHRLERLKAGTEAGRLAFQALGTAAFSVSRSGVVLDLNATAEELVRSDSVLRIVFGRLTYINEQRMPLIRSIEEAIDSREVKTILLTRRGHSMPIEAMLIPRTSQGLLGGEPSLMIVLKTPQVVTEKNLALVAETYGLTPAERRLLHALAGGETVSIYCERQGISRNTVKTQLSSLFGKTGSAQQSDLIRLVYASNSLGSYGAFAPLK